MNILIVEAYTDANVGSCALVENALRILRGRFPDAEIRIMAHEPGVFEELYGVESIKDIFEFPFLKPRLTQIGWLLRTAFWMKFAWIGLSLSSSRRVQSGRVLFRRKLEPLIWADLVISVGAERINDKYFKNIVFSLYLLALVKKLGKKLVIFPATIGPFLFRCSRWLARRVLSRVDLIYVRDELSEKLTRELIGTGADNLVRTADLAVLQEPIALDEALAMIQASETDGIVGISAMRWSYFKNRIETPYSNYGAYVRETALLADKLAEDYKVRIVLYPTNFPVHGCREDDLATAFEIRERMKHGEGVTVLEQLPTPSQLEGMLACSELNFTTRMHACILSTGGGVPTISINYLFKVREYMRSLGLEEFSIDIEEFNAAWALDAFRRMWPEREKWREHIAREMDRKREELARAMERLDGILR